MAVRASLAGSAYPAAPLATIDRREATRASIDTRIPTVLQVTSTGKRVGVSGVVSLLSRGLRERGFAVRVLSLDGGPLIEEMSSLGIPAGQLSTRHQMDFDAVKRLRSYLTEHRVDVVHTHGQRAMFVGNLAARLARVPAVVSSFHEMAAVKATTSRWYRAYYWGEACLARFFTDLCVATSRPVADDARAVRKVPRHKLITILNGVDHERFRPIDDAPRVSAFRARLGLAEEDRVIGCLGSLEPIKGHRHLIEALPRIREKVPQARLVIAGEGPLRDELMAQAARLNVADHVILTGVVQETEMFHNMLDVLALPSLSESTPLVLLESIACRTPVVATRVGGVPDMVRDGETGLLVPPADPEALARAITRVLLDPWLGRRLAAAASIVTESELSADRLATRHEEIYRRLLARAA